jgi:DNA invertase Pin-like site-specific DNA recombinase
MRVIGYVRVSTDLQADSGAGLAAQREAIEAECDRRGWTLLRLVEDTASGKTTRRRPALAAALEDLDDGRADVLVAAKLDRLSRSVLDFAGLMAQADRAGWSLACLDVGVDTSTPAGEMMATVVAAFAQYERRLIGQRTREALAVRKAAGVRLGRPVTVPAAVAARIAAARAAGASLQAIADRLSDEGVPTSQGGARWYPSTVRGVLVSLDLDAAAKAARAA